MQQRVSRSRAILEGIKTHLEEEAMEAENKSAIDLDISDSDRRSPSEDGGKSKMRIPLPLPPAAPALGSIFTTESVLRLFTQQRMSASILWHINKADNEG